MAAKLTVDERKKIFLSLVEAQDKLNNVRKSYEEVTDQFDISEEALREIEEEGLDKEWPPLSTASAN